MEVFNNSVLPKHADDIENEGESVDVIINLQGMLNIGFYSYVNKKWYFHTDTFVEPYTEKGELTDFHWCYVPEEILNIET